MADTQTNHNVPSSSPRPGATGEPEIDLFDYLLVIWRHRWMIAILTFIAMVGTAAYMLTQPRRYEASATIVPPVGMLQNQGGVAGGLGGFGGTMLRDIMDSGSVAGIYVEILDSREVTDAIIDTFDLMHVYNGVNNVTKARRALSRNRRVETTDEGAVKIAVTDLDPNRAAAMANAFVAELDKQNKRLSTGEATSKRIFLEGRLKEVEKKLSQIESIPAHEAAVQEMLYEMLVRECELAKIEEAKSMPTLQVLDEAVVPELPVGRGTVRKGILAGAFAFAFGVLMAFVREYIAAVKGLKDGAAVMQQPEAAMSSKASPVLTGTDMKVAELPKRQARQDARRRDVAEGTQST